MICSVPVRPKTKAKRKEKKPAAKAEKADGRRKRARDWIDSEQPMSFLSCVLICSALLGALAGVRGALLLGGEKPEDLAKILEVRMPMPCQELGEVLCLHNDNVTSGRFAKSSALHLNLTSYVEPFSLSFLLFSLFFFFFSSCNSRESPQALRWSGGERSGVGAGRGRLFVFQR